MFDFSRQSVAVNHYYFYVQHPNRSAGIAEDDVAHRPHLDVVASRARRAVPRDVPRDAGASRAGARPPILEQGVELGLCRLWRHAMSQPPDHVEKVIADAVQPIRRVPERQPDCDAGVHDIGARRHDADHVVEPAVDFDGSSGDRLAFECRLPQVVQRIAIDGGSGPLAVVSPLAKSRPSAA